jgi:hypothetical protein
MRMSDEHEPMDWSTVSTILATGTVTIASVGIKGWFDERSDNVV